MIGLAIRRPIAVCATAAAVVLGGVVAAHRLPVELLPDVALPRLYVTALVPGRSPAATEAVVTARIESVVQQVHGVARVTSTSEEHAGAGYARVDVSFARGTDMQLARRDLSDALARLDHALPPEVGGPYVSTYVPRSIAAARKPFLTFMVTGPHTVDALRGHAEHALVPALREVAGVADVVVQGGSSRALRVSLDAERSAALGVDAADVHRAVAALAVGGHAGTVRHVEAERPVALGASPVGARDVERAIVRRVGRRDVRLGDVARVADSFDDAGELHRVDGLPAVTLTVRKAHAVNAVRVADAVKARVAELEGAQVGASIDVRVLLGRDESAAIRAHAAGARSAVALAAAGILCVLLLAPRALPAAVIALAIVVVAMSAALLGAFVAGLSLDLLSAAAITIGLALVVQSAVVVVENVWRRVGRGEPPRVAAEHGAREVVRPIVGATSVALTVIVPLCALDGAVRAYLAPLTTVLAATVGAGLLLCFTLAPSLAARVPAERRRPMPARPGRWLRPYARVLSWTVRRPRATVALTLGGTVVMGAAAVLRIVQGDAPRSRAARTGVSTLGVRVELPRGASLPLADDIARRFEWIVREHASAAGVSRYVTRVTPARVDLDVDFTAAASASHGPAGMEGRLSQLARSLGGVRARVVGAGASFAGAAPSPPTYAVVVRGYGYETVRALAEGIGDRLRRHPRVRDVDTDAAAHGDARTSEVRVLLDRTRLAHHGLTVHDAIVAVSGAAYGLAGPASVEIDGERLPVAVVHRADQAVQRHALGAVPVLASARVAGRPGVRLADVARFEDAEAPARIDRVDQQYERLVTWEFRGTARIGDAVARDVARTTALPPGYTLHPADDDAAPRINADALAYRVAASLAVVFMLCALLLESLRQPACVLLALPVALTGALAALALGRAALSPDAMLALVVACGLALQGVVLFVDRASRLHVAGRAAGHARSARRAVVRGAVESVRPVVLTGAVTAAAAIALAVAGDREAPRAPTAFGLAIVGALGAVMLFTLTAAPALAALVERRRGAALTSHPRSLSCCWRACWRQRRPPATAPEHADALLRVNRNE